MNTLIWGGYSRISDDPDDERYGVKRQREDIEAVLDEIAGFEQVCCELLAKEAAVGALLEKGTSNG